MSRPHTTTELVIVHIVIMNVSEVSESQQSTRSPNQKIADKRKYKHGAYRRKIKSPKIVPKGWSFSSSETGTQTLNQDMRGQVRIFEFHQSEPSHQQEGGIRKKYIKKKQQQLKPFEIYNYILYGLVEELQQLGTNDKFKEATYHIWLKYLTKVRCIPQDSNTASKLTVTRKKRDKQKCRSNISKTPVNDTDTKIKHKGLEGTSGHPELRRFYVPDGNKGQKRELAYSEVYHKGQKGESVSGHKCGYELPGPPGPPEPKGQKHKGQNGEKRIKGSGKPAIILNTGQPGNMIGPRGEEGVECDRGKQARYGQKKESDTIGDSGLSELSGEKKGLPDAPGPKVSRWIDGLEGVPGQSGLNRNPGNYAPVGLTCSKGSQGPPGGSTRRFGSPGTISDSGVLEHSGKKELPGASGVRSRDGYSRAPGTPGQKADRWFDGLQGMPERSRLKDAPICSAGSRGSQDPPGSSKRRLGPPGTIGDSGLSKPSGKKDLHVAPGARRRDGYSRAPGTPGQKADRRIDGLPELKNKLGKYGPMCPANLRGPPGSSKGRLRPPGPPGLHGLGGVPSEVTPRIVAIMKKFKKSEQQDTQSSSLQSETETLANLTLSDLSTDDECSIDDHNEMTGCAVPQMDDLALEILTRNKIYCILYLAMLLTEQDLQISDVIRYCREENLSFLEYDHFFPDTISDTIDHSIYSGGMKSFPSYRFIQRFSFKLYEFLEILPCDFSPNILKLCRRYCTELNLPDEFYNIAGDFINNTRPFLSITKPTCIANYEGRAMGFIIYVLKLFLSLDDVTEYELSKFARLINNKKAKKSVFNFSEWFTYIEYRKCVLKHVHFPTWQLLCPDEECPLDLYVKYIVSRNDNYTRESSDTAMNAAKKILADLELLQDDRDDTLIKFKPSVTPNRSYLEQLKHIENFKVKDQSLNLNLIKDASKESIEYLITPDPYLKLINAEKCSIFFDNAYPNNSLTKMADNNPPLHQDKTDSENLQNETKPLNKDSEYKYHYMPHKVYYSHIQDVSNMSTEEYKNFESSLPKNFQWLLKECSRIIEQPSKELYEEFVAVEVHINYIYLKNKPHTNKKFINMIIKNFEKNW